MKLWPQYPISQPARVKFNLADVLPNSWHSVPACLRTNVTNPEVF